MAVITMLARIAFAINSFRDFIQSAIHVRQFFFQGIGNGKIVPIFFGFISFFGHIVIALDIISEIHRN